MRKNFGHQHTSYSVLLKWMILISSMLMLSACGNSHPKLTHFKAFDERFNTVIDTKDASQLKTLGDLFYDRIESNDVTANLDFQYLFDVTTKEGAERWRCTKNGYCQLRTEGAQPQRDIFYLERYKELYDMSRLN
jgi:hypothetical protein